MATRIDPSTRVIQLPLALRNLAELAALLERIEQGGMTPDPAQYRSLVEGISAELRLHVEDPALATVLDCFPATAGIYENLHYQAAGLCRQPLEASVESEKAARDWLQELAKARPAGSATGA